MASIKHGVPDWENLPCSIAFPGRRSRGSSGDKPRSHVRGTPETPLARSASTCAVKPRASRYLIPDGMVHCERSSWTEHSISLCFPVSCISPARCLEHNWRRAGSSYDQGTQQRPKLEALLLRCSSTTDVCSPLISVRTPTAIVKSMTKRARRRLRD